MCVCVCDHPIPLASPPHSQKQKSAELRRREEGKQMAESRKDHEDMRNKTWIQERKKAKEEEKKAREAVCVYMYVVCV